MNIASNLKHTDQCHTVKAPVWLAATQQNSRHFISNNPLHMHIQEILGILEAQHHTGDRGGMKLNSRLCGNDQSFLDRANDELHRLFLLLFQYQLALSVSVSFCLCFFFIEEHQCILGVNVIQSILKTQ